MSLCPRGSTGSRTSDCRRALVEEQRFFIGVKLAAQRHDTPLDVDDGLDHVAEARLRHASAFAEAFRRGG